MDRNIREEIVQIVTHFSELCQRLYHTEEGENIFMVSVELCLSLTCIFPISFKILGRIAGDAFWL